MGAGRSGLPRQLGSPLGQEVALGGQLRPGRRGSVIDQAPTITRPFFTGYPTWSQRQRLVSLSVPATRFGLEGGCGLPSGPCQCPWWTHPADPIAAFQFNTVVTVIWKLATARHANPRSASQQPPRAATQQLHATPPSSREAPEPPIASFHQYTNPTCCPAYKTRVKLPRSS